MQPVRTTIQLSSGAKVHDLVPVKGLPGAVSVCWTAIGAGEPVYLPADVLTRSAELLDAYC